MFRRELSKTLEQRLSEPRRFIQIVMGPRQTGKTTAVKQALKELGMPSVVCDAGAATASSDMRIQIEWEQARMLARNEGAAVLFIDEAQKAPRWSDTVKALWDEDAWNGTPLHVVVSGSSSLLLRKGLSDSLKGRFEIIRSTQWTLDEMEAGFEFDLDRFLLYGGYPGAAPLASDRDRWFSYLDDSIVESTISNDVLQLENVRKPALFKRLFELGAYYSGQEMSFRKVLGQLDDRGNTDTLAHYLDLLDAAGMITGLQKYDPKELRSRKSSPRFMVHDTALMSAAWRDRADSLLREAELRGRLVESAVGAHLINRAAVERFELFWWRDGNFEVDFVLRQGERITAIEVKSGRVKSLGGLETFMQHFPQAYPLVVGSSAAPLEDFLRGKVSLFRP